MVFDGLRLPTVGVNENWHVAVPVEAWTGIGYGGEWVGAGWWFLGGRGRCCGFRRQVLTQSQVSPTRLGLGTRGEVMKLRSCWCSVGGPWAWAGTAGSIRVTNIIAWLRFTAPYPFRGGGPAGASGEIDQMGLGGVVY